MKIMFIKGLEERLRTTNYVIGHDADIFGQFPGYLSRFSLSFTVFVLLFKSFQTFPVFCICQDSDFRLTKKFMF